MLGERGRHVSEQRKTTFDKKTVDRTLEVGDQVLCCVLGMSHKLEESRHGPYTVTQKVSRVNYKIDVGCGYYTSIT